MENYVDKLRKIELEILDEIDRVCKENDIKYFLCGGTLLGAVRHEGYIPWDDDIDIAMTREDYIKFCDIAPSQIGDKFLLNCFKTNKKCSYSFAKMVRKGTVFIERKNVGQKHDVYNGIWVDIFPLDEASGIALAKQLDIKKKYERLFTLINIKNNTNYYQNSKIKKKIYQLILLFVPIHYMQNKLEKVVTTENNNDCNFYCSYCSIYSIKTDTHKKETIFPLKEISFEGKKYPCMNDNDTYLKKMYGNYMKLPPLEERITHNPYYIKFPDGEEINFD